MAEKIDKALQKMNYENLQKNLPTIQTSNELSIYNGSLTKDGMAKGMAKILKAFPKFDKNQLEILKERFKENNFTDRRIMDSINNVIDNYEGWDKLPNLANFIKFDKTEKLFTYNELLEKLNEGDLGIFRRSEKIKDKNLWRVK